MTKLVVLGDSYVYEGIEDVESRWPTQLLHKITGSNAVISASDAEVKQDSSWVTQVKLGEHEVITIAKTGKRSDELLAEASLRTKLLANADWIIIGVGVNDAFQAEPSRASLSRYQKNIESLITLAKDASNTQSQQIMLYSIPYWSVTPAGLKQKTYGDRAEKYKLQLYDLAENRRHAIEDICRYNTVASSVAWSQGIHFVNISLVSKWMGLAPGMVLEDGLHYAPAAFPKLFIEPLYAKIALQSRQVADYFMRAVDFPDINNLESDDSSSEHVVVRRPRVAKAKRKPESELKPAEVKTSQTGFFKSIYNCFKDCFESAEQRQLKGNNSHKTYGS